MGSGAITPFKKSPALHLYLMQFVGFFYVLYRIASRSYVQYGFLSAADFHYPRNSILQLWGPLPPVHFLTGQFVYAFVSRPSPLVIEAIQFVILAFAFLGLVGLIPRVAAAVCFILVMHLTGMMIASNSEMDGNGGILFVMLILALTSKGSLYSWKHGFHPRRRNSSHQWPVFLVILLTATFYSTSGLNKIIDVGPHWPFVLHLERLGGKCLIDSMFVSSRYSDAAFCRMLSDSGPLAVGFGFMALIGELGFLTVLFFPRGRVFFILNMLAFHFIVYMTTGISFLGNLVFLFLCFDWNQLVLPEGVAKRCARAPQLPAGDEFLSSAEI